MDVHNAKNIPNLVMPLCPWRNGEFWPQNDAGAWTLVLYGSFMYSGATKFQSEHPSSDLMGRDCMQLGQVWFSASALSCSKSKRFETVRRVQNLFALL